MEPKFNHVRVFAVYLAITLTLVFAAQVWNNGNPKGALLWTIVAAFIPLTWFPPFIATTIHENLWKKAQKKNPPVGEQRSSPTGGQ